MPAVAQTVSNSEPDSNGIISAAITSTATNALVAVVAANIGDISWAVSSVQDDAHNTWVPITTINTDNTTQPNQVMLSVWAAYFTSAVTKVTATMGGATDGFGMAIRVFEVSGLTNSSTLDVSATTASSNATSVHPAATTTNASDFAFAAAAIGNSVPTLTHVADTWTTQTEVTSFTGLFDPDDSLRLDTAYKILSATGSQTTQWNVSGTGAAAVGVICAFKGGSAVTTNANPNWPAMTVKTAFGTQPNSTVGQYTYGTDITQYILDLQTASGSPYEFGATEAGTCSMTLYNQDGRFDPTNTASPYNPNVLDYTPFQVQATWSGVTYGIFTGWVERWPLSWDEVLTETSQSTGVDAFATLSRVKMHTCMQHEVLLDGPYAYWPLSDASGSPFAYNLATGSGQGLTLVPAPPRKAGPGTAGFGAATGFAADENSGWGQSGADAKNDQGWSLTTGVIPSSTFPSIASSGVVTVEAWARYPLITDRQDNSNVFTLKSSAVSWSTHSIISVDVSQNGQTGSAGANVANLFVTSWNSSGVSKQVDAGSFAYCDDRWHLFTLVFSATGYTLYVDGNEIITANTPISTSQIDLMDVGGKQDNWEATNIGLGTYAHVAVYSSALPAGRISAHFQSGHDGFPEQTGERINRLLTYAGWKGPRALDIGDSVLGACFNIQGSDAASAIVAAAQAEAGLVFVDPTGSMRFLARSARFTQTSKGTFGDGSGENHYKADITFDYDPTYLYNDIQITRVGPNNTQGVVQLSGDPNSSIPQYFRSTYQQSVGVLSDKQASDRASFIYNLLYKPILRVKSITITPSDNPALWPVALGVQIGDVWTVKRRPLGYSGALISINVQITEVRHTVKPGSWETTFATIPAPSSSSNPGAGPWQLDDPNLSVLGTSTVPVY